jgi:hypothetical protein
MVIFILFEFDLASVCRRKDKENNIEQFSIVCKFATYEYISMEALTYT